MKKIISLLIVFAICLLAFPGCAGESSEDTLPQAQEPEPYFRVEYVGEGEMIIQNNDWDEILVKYPQSSQFELYDTVVIEFEESDLKEETGTRIIHEDYKVSYSYVLEDPDSVRKAGPGEPTFA